MVKIKWSGQMDDIRCGDQRREVSLLRKWVEASKLSNPFSSCYSNLRTPSKSRSRPELLVYFRMFITISSSGSFSMPGLPSPPEESESLRVPKTVIAFTAHSSIIFAHLRVCGAAKKFGRKGLTRVDLSMAAGDLYFVLGQDRQQRYAR